MNRRKFLTTAAAVAGAGIVGGPRIASAAEAVTFQIDGAAVPFYAPVYVAVENGMFATRDLEVELIYAGASDILSNVASGNVTFGFPNGDAVIAARSAGLPVKVVHTTYQRGIGALLALKKAGISSYADLKGKKVAVTALGSPNYLQLQVGLQKVGLSLADITLEVIATGAIVQSLQAGQVDAIVFSELRKYNLEASGEEVTMISSNDFLPSFGNVIVTGESTLASKPAVVRSFIAAIDEAYQYVIDGHAEEAIAMSIAKYAPTFAGQEASLKRAFEETFIPSVWQSPLTKEKGLGAGNIEGWQTNIDILAEYKVIDKGFPATDLVVQPAEV